MRTPFMTFAILVTLCGIGYAVKTAIKNSETEVAFTPEEKSETEIVMLMRDKVYAEKAILDKRVAEHNVLNAEFEKRNAKLLNDVIEHYSVKKGVDVIDWLAFKVVRHPEIVTVKPPAVDGGAPKVVADAKKVDGGVKK